MDLSDLKLENMTILNYQKIGPSLSTIFDTGSIIKYANSLILRSQLCNDLTKLFVLEFINLLLRVGF